MSSYANRFLNLSTPIEKKPMVRAIITAKDGSISPTLPPSMTNCQVRMAHPCGTKRGRVSAGPHLRPARRP